VFALPCSCAAEMAVWFPGGHGEGGMGLPVLAFLRVGTDRNASIFAAAVIPSVGGLALLADGGLRSVAFTSACLRCHIAAGACNAARAQPLPYLMHLFSFVCDQQAQACVTCDACLLPHMPRCAASRRFRLTRHAPPPRLTSATFEHDVQATPPTPFTVCLLAYRRAFSFHCLQLKMRRNVTAWRLPVPRLLPGGRPACFSGTARLHGCAVRTRATTNGQNRPARRTWQRLRINGAALAVLAGAAVLLL